MTHLEQIQAREIEALQKTIQEIGVTLRMGPGTARPAMITPETALARAIEFKKALDCCHKARTGSRAALRRAGTTAAVRMTTIERLRAELDATGKEA